MKNSELNNGLNVDEIEIEKIVSLLIPVLLFKI